MDVRSNPSGPIFSKQSLYSRLVLFWRGCFALAAVLPPGRTDASTKIYTATRILLVALMLIASNVQAEPRGYLWQPSQFLTDLNRLSFGNAFQDLRLEGDLTQTVACGVSNTHGRKRLYEIDYESYTCGVHVEGSGPSFRYAFDLRGAYVGGGVFDPAIRKFHNAFGFSNGPRTSANDDSVTNVFAASEGGESSITGTHILNPSVSVGTEIVPSWFVYSSAILPVNDDLYGASFPELKLAIAYQSGNNGRFHYGVDVESIVRIDTESEGLRYHPVILGSYSSMEYLLTEGTNVILAQTLGEQSVKNVPEFASYIWYVDFGLGFDIGGSSRLDVTMRENLSPVSSASDVGIFVQFRLL